MSQQHAGAHFDNFNHMDSNVSNVQRLDSRQEGNNKNKKKQTE